jgi:hypothetical protein
MTAQIPPREKARTPVRTISFAVVVRGKYTSPHNQMVKSVIVHTIPRDAGGKRTERPYRHMATLQKASNATVIGRVTWPLIPAKGSCLPRTGGPF